LQTQAQINQTLVELIQGDITHQDTDAIVNAANSSLLGGGGVDGAIHRVAGPELLNETRQLGGCQTGDAKITGGYRLKARHVIHAVGPVYRYNDPGSARLLASAYRRSLEVAAENGLRSIAFPAISTGAYGYPVAEAAAVALETVYEYIQASNQFSLVRFVLFDEQTWKIFSQTLEQLIGQPPRA
jgi:O-acetyl-ADP-ribose deacetylase (regulator of RNase III)